MLQVTRVHFIGIGGIGMSALAKLLKHAGVAVSGSDAAASEITQELERRGIKVTIGHTAEAVPPDTDLVVYSSAVPEQNVERAEARRRNIRQLNNFECWAAWCEGKATTLITGTHGKSTTTALIGLLLRDIPAHPTVAVGSKVPDFSDGNLDLGSTDALVIEGDEYARHFLSFHPRLVVLNNIELDHTDTFANLDDLRETFGQLLLQMESGGTIVANADDPQISTLIGKMRGALEARGITIMTFGFASHADVQIADHRTKEGEQSFAIRDAREAWGRFTLHVPGRINVMNAVAAATVAHTYGVSFGTMQRVLSAFRGIWRRFEIVHEQGKTVVVSDYAHHPTAVRATIEAAKQWFPGRRLVVCFQPHQRRRLQDLFLEFVPSFDAADVLVLCEVYDVRGRNEVQGQSVSSQDLIQAIAHSDADRGATRLVEYAADPQAALALLRQVHQPGDVILVMGAGDIYLIAKNIFKGA